MEAWITLRNHVLGKIYKLVLKPIFFQMDPENIHDLMSGMLKFVGKFTITRKITYILFGYAHSALEQNILGLNFKNPIGLSAGFDKNAELTSIIPSLGFGFEEVGSITGEPCAGNPKPRLWRLKKSKSLVIYYGLKNDGCEAISLRLKNKKFYFPIGISVAKTNSPDTCDTEKGVADYFKAYQAFQDIGAYTTINISCPNAFGGQPFTDISKLDALLNKISSVPKTKPIFLKISPDLSSAEIDNILKTVAKYSIDGFICSNLTKNRDNKKIIDKDVPEKGGISGNVLDSMTLNLIRYVFRKTGGKYIIIGSGGVSSPENAYQKIKAGASLLQLITGMIFEGPQVISEINQGLVKLLKKDGYTNISEAVGKEIIS